MIDHWSEESKDTLRKMWAEGFSAREIGVAVGRKRNGVLGQANRLGLPKHQSMKHRGKDKKKTEGPRKPIRVAFRATPIAPKPLTVITSSGVSFMDAQRYQCRAIIGRDESHLARFCGNPVKEGQSFCDGHYALFYNAPRWGVRA